jgi:hypothetical protein
VRVDVLECMHESMRLGSLDRMDSAHDGVQESVDAGSQKPSNTHRMEEDASVEGDDTPDKVAKLDRYSRTLRMALQPLKSMGLQTLHLAR